MRPVLKIALAVMCVILGALGAAPPPASAAPVQLVGKGSTWRIHDRGTDLGTAWRSPSHDDSGWAQARAQAGFGDGDEVATLATGRPTYYFRQSFSVSSLAGVTGLSLSTLLDDGAVVYLNGTEIWRTSNVPAGQTYSTLATSYVAGAAEQAWTTVTLPATALVAGRNVVAVEVHQQAVSSSDVSFDLGLATVEGATLAAPTGLTGSAASTSSVSLAWQAVPGAASYEVRRDGAAVRTTTSTALTDTGLSTGTTYRYDVRAVAGTSTGPWSNSIAVTTTEGPTALCRVSDTRLTEISGLAASVRFPGIVWVHNDSGDSARVFALDITTCAVRAVVTLSGVSAQDFEAISMGRDAAGAPELWVGDVGDNARARKNIKLYRFAEPASLVNQTVAVKTVTVTWSDGARDCETVMVEPIANGRVFLVSKEATGGFYQLQGDFRTTGTATTGTRLSSTRSSASDGAIAPDRSRTVVRFYDSATMFTGVPGTSPRNFTLPTQPQGEAITFSSDSRYLYIASEGVGTDLIRIPAAGL